MPIETAEYVSELDDANPAESDLLVETDDQIRLVKKAVRQTFPNMDGEVVASPAELNLLQGKTSIPDLEVTITDPQPGQVLKYSGPDWVNGTDETGGGGGGSALQSDGTRQEKRLYGPISFIPSTTPNTAIEITTPIPEDLGSTYQVEFDLVGRRLLNDAAGTRYNVRCMLFPGTPGTVAVLDVTYDNAPSGPFPVVSGLGDVRAGRGGGFFKFWFGELDFNWDWHSLALENIRVSDRDQLESVVGLTDGWQISTENTAFDTVDVGPTTPVNIVPEPLLESTTLGGTFNIGATGDYANLNDAIKDIRDRYELRKVDSSNSGNIYVTLRFEAGETWDDELYLANGDFSMFRIDAVDADITVDGTSMSSFFLKCDNAIAPQFNKNVVCTNMAAFNFGLWLTDNSEWRGQNFDIDLNDQFSSGATPVLFENSTVRVGSSLNITDTAVVGENDCFGFYAEGCEIIGSQSITVANCRGAFMNYCKVSLGTLSISDCTWDSNYVMGFQFCNGNIGTFQVTGTATQGGDLLVAIGRSNLVFNDVDIDQACTTNVSYRVTVNNSMVQFGTAEFRSGATGTGANDVQCNVGGQVSANADANTGVNITKRAFQNDGSFYNGA